MKLILGTTTLFAVTILFCYDDLLPNYHLWPMTLDWWIPFYSSGLCYVSRLICCFCIRLANDISGKIIPNDGDLPIEPSRDVLRMRGRAEREATSERSLRSLTSGGIEPRIVGGEESEIGEFPYFGRLNFDQAGGTDFNSHYDYLS